jgi:hypothetical protein
MGELVDAFLVPGQDDLVSRKSVNRREDLMQPMSLVIEKPQFRSSVTTINTANRKMPRIFGIFDSAP